MSWKKLTQKLKVQRKVDARVGRSNKNWPQSWKVKKSWRKNWMVKQKLMQTMKRLKRFGTKVERQKTVKLNDTKVQGSKKSWHKSWRVAKVKAVHRGFLPPVVAGTPNHLQSWSKSCKARKNVLFWLRFFNFCVSLFWTLRLLCPYLRHLFLSLQLLRIIFHVFQFFSQHFFKFPGGLAWNSWCIGCWLSVGLQSHAHRGSNPITTVDNYPEEKVEQKVDKNVGKDEESWETVGAKVGTKVEARQSWGKSWKDSWRQKWPKISGALHPSLFCQLLFVPSTFESAFFGSLQLLSQLAFEPLNFGFNFCVNLFPTFQLLRIFF